MTHPLIKLSKDAQAALPASPFGLPPPPAIAIEQLIEYAKSQYLIITVTPDTDAKRAALLKARDALDAELASLTPAPVDIDERNKIDHDNAAILYEKAHGKKPHRRELIGAYTNGGTIFYGDY